MNITGSFASGSHYRDSAEHSTGAFTTTGVDNKFKVTMTEERDWFRIHYGFNASRS